jgi:hypothetical protein
MNYQEIIENLRDEDVFHLLEQLGAQPIDKGNCFICKTICHNEDADQASQKLYYYKDTHLFYCYTECGALSIFKLLKNYYEIRNIAYDWYNDIYQVILNCSISVTYNADVYRSIKSDYTVRKARKELPTYPNELIEVFTHYYPIEWLQDNITQEVMDKYNIRYSISQNKIIIPHYNINGDLVGIRGRALNPEEAELYGKYMPVQIEGKWYSHPLSLNLYGLNWNKDNIRNSGICFIFESEKSVMQVESFNGRNCAVASCGSNINKYQMDLLMRYCAPRQIVICFDNEEKEGEDKYFTKLWNMCKKYRTYCNMSFIYDRNNITKKKDSPSDNGEEIFAKLLKERIKVR